MPFACAVASEVRVELVAGDGKQVTAKGRLSAVAVHAVEAPEECALDQVFGVGGADLALEETADALEVPFEQGVAGLAVSIPPAFQQLSILEHSLSTVARTRLPDSRVSVIVLRMDDSKASSPLPDPTLSEGVETRRLRAAMRSRLGLGKRTPNPVRLGRFVVRRQLGEGGMGTVFEAFDPTLDRRVALKIMRRDRRDARARARLLQEARTLAQLDHRNVVRVFEVGEYEDEVVLVMELVEGQSLDTWVEDAGREAWRAIVAGYVQAAEGLAAAHAVGIVHRDFKPSNVMRTEAGRVCVLDFGLAQPDVGDSTEDTQAGSVEGTPRYMAPEQRAGRATDARADQYSFCVALHEALTGLPPSAASSASGLPRWLRGALQRGLSETPADRFPSMTGLLEVLNAGLQPSGGRAGLWAGAAGVLLVVGGVGVSMMARHPAQTLPAPCASGRAELEEAWSSERSLVLAANIQRAGLPAAAEVAASIVAALDARGDAWVQAWDDACRATVVERVQTAETMELRQACLAENRAALGGVVRRGADEALDAGGIQALAEAVYELRPIAWCEEVAVLRKRVELPREPERRARVLGLQAELERLWLDTTMRGSAPAEVYDDALAQAKAVDYAPLIARVLFEQGMMRQRHHEGPQAEALFRDAIAIAAKAGDAALEAEVWAGLARAVASHDKMRGDEEAKVALEAARAAALRAPDPVWSAAQIDYAESAIALYVERDLQRALDLLTRGIAGFEASEQSRPLDVYRAVKRLGTVYSKLGRYDEAVAAGTRALTLAESTLGKRHALVASAHYALMEVEYDAEAYASALDHAEQAYALRRDTGGADDYYTLLMANAVAACLSRLGRHEDAVEWASRAVDGYLASDRRMVRVMAIEPLSNRAEALIALGRLDEASHDLEQALEGAKDDLAADHGLVMRARALQKTAREAGSGAPSGAVSSREE